MKIQIKKSTGRGLGLLASLTSILSVFAQTEVYCTQDMYSSENLLFLQKPVDSVVSPVPGNLPMDHPFQTYDTCSNSGNRLRAVAYIHGLGGSRAAWDKQITFTIDEYSTASFGVDYSSNAFTESPTAMGQKVNTELDIGFNQVNAYYYRQNGTERCLNDDYVIAHSQGGIAARYLDWRWNTDSSGAFGARKYYGLVTFGYSACRSGCSPDKRRTLRLCG